MKNVKEVEVKVKGKEWEDALDKAYNKQKKDVKLDGFRKGSVPKDIFIKHFGIEVLFNDAVDFILNDIYQKTMKDNDFTPVIEPIIDVTHICEKDINFKFTFIEKPEVKLGKYKGLGIKQESVSVSAEEIEKEIENLRNQYVDIVENNDGKIEDGNTVTIDFKGKVDGKELEGGNGENYPLEIGSNTFIKGFEKGLIGMKVGEEKVLNLKFPEDYVENLKGKEVEFTVKVNGIKQRILPELNEEFYKDLGYENIKTKNEFESEISAKLLEQKKVAAENDYIEELIKKASDNLKVEINPEIINDEADRVLKQHDQMLQMQGLNLDSYLKMTGKTMDDMKKMVEPEATYHVKARYLLEEISAAEKIEVTDKEVDEEIKKISELYGMTEEEVINAFQGKDIVKYDIEMRKAIEILKK